MDVIAAYREVGSYRGAAAMYGTMMPRTKVPQSCSARLLAYGSRGPRPQFRSLVPTVRRDFKSLFWLREQTVLSGVSSLSPTFVCTSSRCLALSPHFAGHAEATVHKTKTEATVPSTAPP